MKSRTTSRFREAFANLPHPVKDHARQAYKRFKNNPNHPSLRFKKVHQAEPIFSVRVGLGYRAVGIQAENQMVWFWIGSHADYDKILRSLSK
ncbi:MAG: hypothetical protein ACRD2L_01015 [Terriglobia bacterium]